MTPTPTPPTDQTPHDPDAAAARHILIGVVIFLAAWGGSIALWGIPGLYIPALILVPVVYAVLLLISRS